MAIWIGQISGANWNSTYLRKAATLSWAPRGHFLLAPPGGSFAKNTQSQTLGIGELFIQAVSATVPDIKFHTPPKLANIVRQIWPFRTAFLRPPGRVISDAETHFIVDHFDRFTAALPFAPGPAGDVRLICDTKRPDPDDEAQRALLQNGERK